MKHEDGSSHPSKGGGHKRESITCIPLGAGQDIGKSCVVVTVGQHTIMFDCGLHMGYQDDRRFPDFSFLQSGSNKGRSFDDLIDCVIVTHFHMDHCGALPLFTEVCGYHGPIYMTFPTKALSPLMLSDYHRVMTERRGEEAPYSLEDIEACIARVVAVDVKQTVEVVPGLTICGYYAGHVLGAAMFLVQSGTSTVLYTGDFNTTPDRCLGPACVPRLRPDVMISESTYATTIRDSKRLREGEFLSKVHACVSEGGKVLIPVFALGRAQELCLLLDEYWARVGLGHVPIYFSAGLSQQATVYYKMLLLWTSRSVQQSSLFSSTSSSSSSSSSSPAHSSVFDFRHVTPFDRSLIDAPGPCVAFATPGMLSGGLSLEIFKKWAPAPGNLLVLPGFCVAGTVGSKVMSLAANQAADTGNAGNRIEVDRRTQLDVRCKVHQLTFSPHADSKGILDVIRHVDPCHVILVHGERAKMAKLKDKVIKGLGIKCFDPPNHARVTLPARAPVKVEISREIVDDVMGGLKRGLVEVEGKSRGEVAKPEEGERRSVDGDENVQGDPSMRGNDNGPCTHLIVNAVLEQEGSPPKLVLKKKRIANDTEKYETFQE